MGQALRDAVHHGLINQVTYDVGTLVGDCPLPCWTVEALKQERINDSAALTHVCEREVVFQAVAPLKRGPFRIIYQQPPPTARQRRVLALDDVTNNIELPLAGSLVQRGRAFESVRQFRLICGEESGAYYATQGN
jgi:hypothetical protein